MLKFLLAVLLGFGIQFHSSQEHKLAYKFILVKM